MIANKKPKPKVRRRAYPMPPRDQIALSVDETCAITGIGRTNILAAVHDGTLPSRHLGSRYIIKRSDAEAYVDNLPQRSAGGAKQMGARNAGNPHVACDVEGTGDVAWSR
jgi:excisionase family DNA binding protein